MTTNHNSTNVTQLVNPFTLSAGRMVAAFNAEMDKQDAEGAQRLHEDLEALHGKQDPCEVLDGFELASAPVERLEPKEVSKEARKALKSAFPGHKFSVRTLHGTSVNVSWTDGPTTEEVEAVIGHMRAGDFNGMTDSFDYDRGSKYGNQYMFCNRTISLSTHGEIRAELETTIETELSEDRRSVPVCARVLDCGKIVPTTHPDEYADQIIRSAFCRRSLPLGQVGS